MAKKHKHPEHENLERWLVSYADFMTLLFATFTALYALSLSDVNKLKDVSAAISQGFEEQSLLNGIKSILEGKSPPTKNPDTIPMDSGQGNGLLDKFKSMTYSPGEIESTQKFAKSLTQDIQALNQEIQAQSQGKGVSLFNGEAGSGTEDASAAIRPIEASVQERGIRVSFDSRLLFPAGTATVRPEAYPFLDIVAQRLKKFQGGHVFHVEGHTDSQGISTQMFPSNWELSGARASSIVRYFTGRQKINPSSMVAVGYGSTQPVATNDTAEGRAKNRRVDIIIYTEKMSAILNPRLQALQEKPLVHKTSNPDAKTVIPALPAVPDKSGATIKTTQSVLIHEGPVKVIIKEKDGTEKVLIPKTKKLSPEPTSATPVHVDVHSKSGGSVSPSAQSAPQAQPIKTVKASNSTGKTPAKPASQRTASTPAGKPVVSTSHTASGSAAPQAGHSTTDSNKSGTSTSMPPVPPGN